MHLKIALTLLLFIPAYSCSFASDLLSLKITCIDKQGPGNDDVYAVFVVDSNTIKFDKNDQKGTSEKNHKDMNTGDSLTFNDSTRGKLKFTSKLQIILKEDDVTVDDVFGSITLDVNSATKKGSKTFKGGSLLKKYEYKIEWEHN